MPHTKKHGKSYFGDKPSVSVNLKRGFIRNIATSTASEHDGHHLSNEYDAKIAAEYLPVPLLPSIAGS